MNLRQMAADVRKLKKQVASMGNVTIEGYSRIDSANGVAFGRGSRTILPILIPSKTVVITVKPLATHTTLTVREAKYTTNPPKKCVGVDPNVVCFYEWFGVDFEVYPPLGKEAIDYEGDEWNGATDPKIDTVFHRCHREHEAWVLDLQAEGGASIVFVRVIDSILPNTPASQFLSVQKMKKVEPIPPETKVTWIPDGESEPAECWPNYVAGHYLPMRHQNPEVIVPMTKVGGTQYVWQKNRWFIGTPVSSLPRSDCLAPIGP